MRKFLLALVICLTIPFIETEAQTYRYQASQFAYRIRNAYGNWTSWSNWQYSQIVIDITMDKDVIIVYSDPRQVYAVYEYVGAENDSGGGRQVYYKVIDQDYDYGTVRLRIEANGNSQMYVDFNDVSWCYSGLKRIY